MSSLPTRHLAACSVPRSTYRSLRTWLRQRDRLRLVVFLRKKTTKRNRSRWRNQVRRERYVERGTEHAAKWRVGRLDIPHKALQEKVATLANRTDRVPRK